MPTRRTSPAATAIRALGGAAAAFRATLGGGCARVAYGPHPRSGRPLPARGAPAGSSSSSTAATGGLRPRTGRISPAGAGARLGGGDAGYVLAPEARIADHRDDRAAVARRRGGGAAAARRAFGRRASGRAGLRRQRLRRCGAARAGLPISGLTTCGRCCDCAQRTLGSTAEAAAESPALRAVAGAGARLGRRRERPEFVRQTR